MAYCGTVPSPVRSRARLGHQPDTPPARALAAQWAPDQDPSPSTEILAASWRDALFTEFSPLVRRLVRQYGGSDPEMRQDLRGEIYWRFTVLLDAYDPSRGIPLRPYLVRQLTAGIYTYARHHWRRRRREVCLDTSEGIGATRHLAEDPSREWDDNLMMEQMRSALPRFIGRLPERQRKVVVWRYYESRSFEEIAAALGVQNATARSILRHGLNNMRRWIALENEARVPPRVAVMCQ